MRAWLTASISSRLQRWAMLVAVTSVSCYLQLDARAEERQFAGDAACLACHQQQALPYQRTAHHLTSQPASPQTMKLSLPEGAKTLTITTPGALPGLAFVMRQKDGRYSQSAVTGWSSHLQTRAEPIDIILGSGKRGQTFLSWDRDRLFELPASYWTDGARWINSPGYDDGTADFSRPINPGCLECHATAIRAVTSDPLANRYDPGSLVTGIACETCHGSGRAHFALQKEGSAGSEQAILNPAHFSRDRQVDQCALCHNGIERQALQPAFTYQPGEPLDRYYKPLAAPAGADDHPDVHGNQVGLLMRSRCYLSSPQMTCSTCHNVHAAEQPAAAYSTRCLTCHQWQRCGAAKTMGHAIVSNCIDCHMPVQATNLIVSETGGSSIRATMRNHWIKIYPATLK